MEIAAVETCDPYEFIEVSDSQAPSTQLHDPAHPQFTQNSVDVHRGQAERVTKNDLRQREVKAPVLRQADVARSHIELAHEVRDALQRVAPAQAYQPSPQGVFVDQLRP